MKDVALGIVASRTPGTDGRNLLREYLQSRILGQLQAQRAFVPLAFMGGMALRFLYRIPRFSEDLGFTLERGAQEFSFEALATGVERGLVREGYTARTSVGLGGAVKRAMIAFPGLLAESGLSVDANQTLKIQLEVDTNPPRGAGLTVSTVNRFGPLRVQHHDMTSLFAGKTAAVLARTYTKGRDYYDLMWYLTQTPQPEMNLELLRNALLQTAPDIAEKAAADWRAALRQRIETVDWDDARRDLAPFLEQGRDLALIEPATFRQLLEQAALH